MKGQPPRLSALARVLLLGAASLAAVAVEHALPLGLLCVGCGLALAATRPPPRRLLQGGLLLLTLVWSTVLSQSLFYPLEPRVPLLQLGPLTFWREGALAGLVAATRFVALTLGGLALSLSTPTPVLADTLQRLGAPPALAFLASAAMRFVPTAGEELLSVREAAASRGRPIWARGPLDWLRLELALLRPVISRALRRASALAESLEARGFDPAALPDPEPMPPGRWDRPALLLAGGTVAALWAARALYLLYTAELLYLPALRPVYALVRVWL